MGDISQILARANAGDLGAANELLSLVYQELRAMAQQQMRVERPGQTLSATALVHEAYLRLLKNGHLAEWNSRAHFFSAAAEAMRRILVEAARRKQSQKRGGGWERVALDPTVSADNGNDARLLAIDEALAKLHQEKPQIAHLVKLRYFGGFTMEESANCLNVSPRTAKYWWAYAKAWLAAEIGDVDPPDRF